MRAHVRDPTDSAGAGVQVADVRAIGAKAHLRDPTDSAGAGVQVADVRAIGANFSELAEPAGA